jgi:hypothetical protein
MSGMGEFFEFGIELWIRGLSNLRHLVISKFKLGKMKRDESL